MLEEETSEFAIFQMEMFEIIASTSSIFAEDGMDSGTNTAVREDQNVLVGVLLTKHSKKTVDTKLKGEQGLFAVIGFSEAVVVVPDFCKLEQREFAVDCAEIAFQKTIVADDFGHAGDVFRCELGGLEGTAQRRTIDGINLR